MNIIQKIDNYVNSKELNESDSLNDKELFVLGLILGLKSSARKTELESMQGKLKPKYNVTVDEYDTIKNSLIKKRMLSATGGIVKKNHDAIYDH
jgi:hypothetical protein